MRQWHLFYSLEDPKKEFSIKPKHFDFLADSDDDAISTSLNKLRVIAKRTKKQIRFDMLVRKGEGKNEGTSDKVYRVKLGYMGRRLLRIKNYRDYLVEGVGPEALKALDG